MLAIRGQTRFPLLEGAGAVRRRRKTRLFSLSLCLWLGAATCSVGQEALPPSLEERFQEAVRALKAGQLETAEKAFQEVLRQGGRTPFVYNNLGIVYQQRGEHSRAVPQFREAIRRKADYPAPRILIGASLLALGRNAEAVTELEAAVKLAAEEPQPRLLLAKAYERTGNIPGLVDQFRALRELSPQEPEHAYQLGRNYLKLSAWCLQEILRLDRRSARLYQTLGENYKVQGRLDLAARAFREASQIDPKLPEIHLALAQLHLAEGRLDEARQELDRELAVIPDSAAALQLKQKLEEAARGP